MEIAEVINRIVSDQATQAQWRNIRGYLKQSESIEICNAILTSSLSRMEANLELLADWRAGDEWRDATMESVVITVESGLDKAVENINPEVADRIEKHSLRLVEVMLKMPLQNAQLYVRFLINNPPRVLRRL